MLAMLTLLSHVCGDSRLDKIAREHAEGGERHLIASDSDKSTVRHLRMFNQHLVLTRGRVFPDLLHTPALLASSSDGDSVSRQNQNVSSTCVLRFPESFRR